MVEIREGFKEEFMEATGISDTVVSRGGDVLRDSRRERDGVSNRHLIKDEFRLFSKKKKDEFRLDHYAKTFLILGIR